MLFGRICKLELYPVGTTPQEVPSKEPKYEYFYDGSKQAHEIDFRIEGAYTDKIRSPHLEGMAVSESAHFVLYNIAAEEQFEPGMTVRFQSGYRELEPGLKDTFIGILRAIPPVRWRGSDRLYSLVCDNGLTRDAKGWLGRQVFSEDGKKLGRSFQRSWNVIQQQYEDTDPFFSKEIARKLVEEIAEANFKPGALSTSDPIDALVRFVLGGGTTGVLEVGGPNAPFTVPLVPEVAAPLTSLEPQQFQLSSGLHQAWLDKGLTVSDLSEKGNKHFKPFRVEGTAWDGLVKLADKSEMPAPIFHNGDTLWNPRPQNSNVKITATGGDLVTLTNKDDHRASASRVPGILQRVEVLRRPMGGNDAGQSRADSGRERLPSAHLRVPAVHLPDVFAGSVFTVEAEPQTIAGFELDKAPSRGFSSDVQVRHVVHEGRSRAETWTSTMDVRLLEG
ncbi:MAG: hypothetical protein ABEL51_05715 [Salinibacter sp.]